MDTTTLWAVIVLFFIFILAVAIKFRNVKTLNQIVLNEGEKILFEEQPVRIWLDRGLGQGGHNRKTTVLMRPIIKITNTRIIVGQRFLKKPDARVYTIFSLKPVANSEGSFEKALSDGFVTTEIDIETVRARHTDQGDMIVSIVGTIRNVPIIGSVASVEIMRVRTKNISEYERALGKRIEVAL